MIFTKIYLLPLEVVPPPPPPDEDPDEELPDEPEEDPPPLPLLYEELDEPPEV